MTRILPGIFVLLPPEAYIIREAEYDFVETIMQLVSHSRIVARWAGATMVAMFTTVVLASIGASATTAGMIFLVVVVWSATQAGIALSLYIAMLCAFSFDYFFLPPYHTLVLAGWQEWVAIFSFVVSSLVAGRVAERARLQAQQA